MIYHDRSNMKYSSNEYSKKANIQFILFLNRLLIDFEKRYWSIELKMTELVWIVKRIRHMIESVTKTTVIFIDHVANFSIVKQTTLNSENIDKLNFRFVRISTYFSQFNIDVRYKTERINIVSNALFRLSAINFFKNVEHMNTLDIDSYHCFMQDIFISAHAFQESLIFMTSNFRIKLIENYSENKIWSKIMKSLKDLNTKVAMKNAERNETSREQNKTIQTDIDFEMHDELIYHKENRKLCIFKFMKKKYLV